MLRDWVHRFNEKGTGGPINGKAPGPRRKLLPEQKQELKRIVEAGPDPVTDSVVRWRRVDLRRVIKERFDVDLDEVSIGRALNELGFAHVSPRPRHPKQDSQVIAVFRKNFPARVAEAIIGKGIHRDCRSRSGFPVKIGSLK